MKRLLDLVALFGTIAVLMMIMLWLRDIEFTGDTLFHPKSLASTGFIILAAFSMGEFFKLLNIPALLGYIAAGVLFGPNLAPLLPGAPEALFSSDVISNLALINVLTVGVLGTLGGGELKIDEIKQNITTILAMFGTVFVIVVLGFSGLALTVGALTGAVAASLAYCAVSGELASLASPTVVHSLPRLFRTEMPCRLKCRTTLPSRNVFPLLSLAL